METPTQQKFFVNGEPTPALLQLLELFRVKHGGTLLSICRATQAEWYQKGKLRAEIGEQHGQLREKAMPLFEELGLIKEVRVPTNITFEVALIHGATLPAVQKRIAFLAKEWSEREVRFKAVGLLGSERTLITNKEELWRMAPEVFGVFFKVPDQKVPLPSNEFWMMWEVYRRAALPWKGVISNPTVYWYSISAPGRATTEETLRLWCEVFKPQPGNFLNVSSQPFVIFQQLTAEKVFPPDSEVFTIGYRAPETMPVTTYLDNIAKIIYELALRYKQI